MKIRQGVVRQLRDLADELESPEKARRDRRDRRRASAVLRAAKWLFYPGTSTRAKRFEELFMALYGHRNMPPHVIQTSQKLLEFADVDKAFR